MTGKYNIIIQNRYVKYEFEVKRKYTIIRGDSASGKTYMCDMLREPTTIKKCDVKITVLPFENWDIILESVSGQIFVVDENFIDIETNDFAKAMKYSENYFILITRRKLSAVPYSVSEIYNLVSTRKYNNMNKPFTFTSLQSQQKKKNENIKPEILITEDSNSGFQFFDKISDIPCISAKSKDRVISTIKDNITKYDRICSIVDGAAFGACIDDITVMLELYKTKNICIFMPESFEYLMLKCIPNICSRKYLDFTYDYCDLSALRKICIIYEDEKEPVDSWEQFYTKLLCGLTFGTNLNYSKRVLNENYLKFKDIVLDELGEIEI